MIRENPFDAGGSKGGYGATFKQESLRCEERREIPVYGDVAGEVIEIPKFIHHVGIGTDHGKRLQISAEPVLGLIFLRYADVRFTQAEKELTAANGNSEERIGHHDRPLLVFDTEVAPKRDFFACANACCIAEVPREQSPQESVDSTHPFKWTPTAAGRGLRRLIAALTLEGPVEDPSTLFPAGRFRPRARSE